MRKFLWATLVSFLLFSCTTKEIQVKSKQIDSLVGVIDSLNKHLLLADIDSVNRIISVSEKLWYEFLATGFKGLDDQDKLKLSRLVNITKQCNKFIDKYETFQKELSFTEHQLTTLQYDLENKAITDSLFSVYYQDESSILSNLKREIFISINSLDKNFEYYIKVINESEEYRKRLNQKEPVDTIDAIK